MRYLSLRDCFGLNKVDRLYHVSAGEINPATNRAYAINPGSGNWDDNYFARTYGNNPANNYGNPGATASFEQLAQKQLDFQRQANKPAIDAIRASIPTTEAAYAQRQTSLEGQKQPLEDRYASLVNELKRREGVDTQTASLNTAQEYGKRGIPLSSGAYDQALMAAQKPINEYYTGQTTSADLSKNSDLLSLANQIASLPIEKQTQLDAINQSVGQLEAGAASSGIQNALALLQQQQQASQFQQSLAEQQRQSNVANALAQSQFDFSKTQNNNANQYATLSEGQTLYDLLSRTGIYTAPKTYKPSTSSGASGW